jgi:predicted lipoprotein with Yx(FWY)xxD motif
MTQQQHTPINQEPFSMKRTFLMVLIFLLTALPALAQDDAPLDALINFGGDEEFSYLVGPDGMTLYLFTLDDADCVDACLDNWPPLTVESEDELTKAAGIPGNLGTFEREDGTLQATYNDIPLYYWVNDEAPGDTTGDGVGNVWYIVEPAELYVGRNSDLGTFIVGPEGMTLYLFTADDATCTGDCLVAWPPFTAESLEDIRVSRDLPGEVGLFEREDGTQQVMYNGIPLYYWQDDAAPGDTTGQGVGDVWYVLQTLDTRTSDDLGEYLVGPNGLTLYLFTPDDATCTGDCLAAWPPVMAAAPGALQIGTGVDGELGTFDRNGEMQVTYNGIPLYYWQDDAAPGDTTGQGVGDVWFVVNPAATAEDMMTE